MLSVLVYGDSLSWGIVPGERRRLPFEQRWPGVMENGLLAQRISVRVIENCLNGRRTVWEDPFKPGRNGLQGIEQVMELNSPLDLVILCLGTNDMQFCYPFNNAWSSAQGVTALVNAMRRAPIEPGMQVPPILIVAPPPAGTPRGTMVEKFAGAEERGRGMAKAFRAVSETLGCAFFDAGMATRTSEVDGVHLDAEHHREFGEAITPVVAGLLKTKAS
jgi:lysophospholipase L1-like esterase